MAVFQTGISGLIASQQNIEVLSNNVANSATVGFKKSKAVFGDMVLQTQQAAAQSPGTGVRVADIAQVFAQGSITRTEVGTDFAISGDGFFKVKNAEGDFTYTRNGQFLKDREGFLVNYQGERLQSFNLNPLTKTPVGDLVDLRIPEGPIKPKQTSEIQAQFNLPANADVIALPFDPDNLDTFNRTTSLTLFDQTGNPQTLELFFRRVQSTTQNTSNWELKARMGNTLVPAGDNLVFGANGVPQDATVTAFATRTLDFSGLTDVNNNKLFGADPLKLDLSGTTQFGSGFQVVRAAQDGYTSGDFTRFDIAPDGKISLNYSNNQRVEVAQLPLYRFVNPNGLIPVGDNAWVGSSDAGPELLTLSGEGATTEIIGGALEDSNVDLTQSLVDMITAQRIYQSNSQSIQTQDDLLQTAIALRN